MEEKEYKKLVEKTLIVLKPDTIQRGLIGEIISRFERVGLKLIAIKMVKPDELHFYKHYEEIGGMISRRGESAFRENLNFMQRGPVVAIVLEGVEAVANTLKIVGPTEPKKADMGTIRGDYAHVSFGYANSKKIGIANLIHASGTPEEAKKEIKHWFKREDLIEYKSFAEMFM